MYVCILYIYIYVYVYIYMYIYVYIYIYICIYIYVYIHTCMCIYIYIHVYVYIYIYDYKLCSSLKALEKSQTGEDFVQSRCFFFAKCLRSTVKAQLNSHWLRKHSCCGVFVSGKPSSDPVTYDFFMFFYPRSSYGVRVGTPDFLPENELGGGFPCFPP